jgi:membrane protein
MTRDGRERRGVWNRDCRKRICFLRALPEVIDGVRSAAPTSKRVRAFGTPKIWPWLIATAITAAFVGTTRSPATVGRRNYAAALADERERQARSGDRGKEESAEPTGFVGAIRGALGKIPFGASLFDAAMNWVKHNDARTGAALSYYSIFSIGPLIVIAIAIAGLFFGNDAVRGEVTSAVKGLVGESGSQAIDMMLASANKPREGIVAIIIGTGTLILAGIGVVSELKSAMNQVWEVEPPPSTGVWGFLRTYVISLAGIAAVGFLLLVSMLATAAIAALGKLMPSILPEPLLQIVSEGLSLVILAAMFGLMFKWLPDAKVGWRDVISGAILTAILFEAGKFLIGFYIGKQGLESTYGAAASIVVIMVWVYYSAQIVLYGAEFTAVRTKRRRRVAAS